MNEVRVESWAELQERLFEDSWNPALQRFRSQYAFRGLSNACYPLRTTLARLGGPYARMEMHLLRNFMKYAHQTGEGDSLWDWVALAQHHGLPTRLMDWTYSPFVAMHFATSQVSRYDIDGAIWAVHYVRAHQMLPKVLRKELEHEGSDVFTVEMLTRSASTLAEFDALSTRPFLLFLEPPSMDDRIVNQYALFSIPSLLDTPLDEWLIEHPELYRKIIIPAQLKWEIRDKLDQANITERVLFPGLDGLSRWLKRHYTPRDVTVGLDTET